MGDWETGRQSERENGRNERKELLNISSAQYGRHIGRKRSQKICGAGSEIL